jgi:hypothetical protein
MRILIIWLALCSACYAEKKTYTADLETRLARVQAQKELKASYRQAKWLVKKYGCWEEYQYSTKFKWRY